MVAEAIGIGLSGSHSPSAFSPAQIAGMLEWLDATWTLWKDSAGMTAATEDGDPVGRWTDRSVNGTNATQATDAKRPTLKLNVQNGNPVVRYDGVDDFLAAALTTAQPITLFVVAKSAANKVLLDGDDATDRVLWYTNSSGNWEAFAGTSLAADARLNAFHQHSVIYNGASSQVWKDGVSQAGPGAAGSNGLSGLTIGDAYLRDGGQAFNGDVGEILIYSGALAAADREAVQAYLKGKWSTP
jgi:hypothetical protein